MISLWGSFYIVNIVYLAGPVYLARPLGGHVTVTAAKDALVAWLTHNYPRFHRNLFVKCRVAHGTNISLFRHVHTNRFPNFRFHLTLIFHFLTWCCCVLQLYHINCVKNFTQFNMYRCIVIVLDPVFIRGSRGARIISIGGFKFLKQATYGIKTRWYCRCQRNGCKAVIYTIEDQIIKCNNNHNHDA